MKECPYCKSQIKKEYIRCPKCGKELDNTNVKEIKTKNKKIDFKDILIKTIIVLIAVVALLIYFVTKGKIYESKCSDTIITLKEVQAELVSSKEDTINKYNGNYYTFNAVISNMYDRYIEIKDESSGEKIYVNFELTSRSKLNKKEVGDSIKFCGRFNISDSEYNISHATILE